MRKIKIDDFELMEETPLEWTLKKKGAMNVPGLIFGTKEIIQHLVKDVKDGKIWSALPQIRNVASLPGIQESSYAMSDVHPGYGVCIGGVAAFDAKTGVIALAGVGYDINCGVRTHTTPLKKKDVVKKQKEILDALYQIVPAGLGSKGKIHLNQEEIDEVLIKGAEFAVERGYGLKEDLEYIENNGRIKGANPKFVSDLAKKRQFKQVGTLGSGNHYFEVQYVEKIYDKEAAKAFGLEKDQVVFSLHCGSRALGHQIGTDYTTFLAEAARKYKIKLPDKELVCAPFKSKEGQQYFSAVNCGINAAFANRQVIGHLGRQAFSKVFGLKEKDIPLLYDIGHNNSKLENHMVNGKEKELIVHRKGATRAFGPGLKEVPKKYRKIGQPVLIGGTMGTSSYILHGTKTSMEKAFGSAAHGAGRVMSRHQANRQWKGQSVKDSLEKQGILVKGHDWRGLAEEAPGAYKDVDIVIDVLHKTGLAKKVAKLKPLVVVKG
ncbi:RtcB family protein [Candidatus Woesearchaeota archaeon]|jgi:tRNA-splicing ligase RtcB (3'-phosphate/5'-hydroxy nucleic acid ligase)|nr:RtcB family protein [Candidatus Woesearchaeota archaeon]MBT7062986.1 RtcB family protein [Candidatus Woesearchaeota archaeon]MBT7402803.1 RtcB family protein [Candidatus Woesearchaeota archaeon]